MAGKEMNSLRKEVRYYQNCTQSLDMQLTNERKVQRSSIPIMRRKGPETSIGEELCPLDLLVVQLINFCDHFGTGYSITTL